MCSRSKNSCGSVAQLVERTTENREVTGSTPVGATTFRVGQSPIPLAPPGSNYCPDDCTHKLVHHRRCCRGARQKCPIIVADDEDRENEGDVVVAAELAGQECIAWIVRYSSGFTYVPPTNEIADRLNLLLTVAISEDPRDTASVGTPRHP